MKKSSVAYKCLPKPVYVDPAQVISTKVNVAYIGSHIHISQDKYQQYCDSYLKNCLCPA